MTPEELADAFARVCAEPMPLPGNGDTPTRHKRLFAAGEQDLTLAKLAEAHWDALAILAEAGRTPEPGALYAVWASEIPHKPLRLEDGHLSGEKAFCSGYGLVSRALVTIGTDDGRLIDVNVSAGSGVQPGKSQWQPEAFKMTNTGPVIFADCVVDADAVIGKPGFYTDRPGFWHGACGPAACWAGGVAGLIAYATQSARDDAHTMAHLGAMHSNIWAMQSVLEIAGHEIDADPHTTVTAHKRALKLRHTVEQLATDTLRRFARAYGPFPLTLCEETARRYHEVDIYLRQSHGERDLHALAELIRRAE